MKNNAFLVIEPFYGGSHKQLIDVVFKDEKEVKLHEFKAKKWHWRARVSALKMSQMVGNTNLL